jgi:hypothetical protein
VTIAAVRLSCITVVFDRKCNAHPRPLWMSEVSWTALEDSWTRGRIPGMSSRNLRHPGCQAPDFMRSGGPRTQSGWFAGQSKKPSTSEASPRNLRHGPTPQLAESLRMDRCRQSAKPPKSTSAAPLRQPVAPTVPLDSIHQICLPEPPFYRISRPRGGHASQAPTRGKGERAPSAPSPPGQLRRPGHGQVPQG